MSVLLAIGLDEHLQILSAAAIVCLIVRKDINIEATLTTQATFAVGLGPVPFLLISELVPAPVRCTSSSLSCPVILTYD
jgi:SP family facilitated glucose transporter-like MFS transporter 3